MHRLITKHALHSSPNRFFFSSCKGRSTASVLTEPNKLRPPLPKKQPTKISAHGKTWDDPYQWMSNLQDSDLSRYLQQENQYAESVMSDTIEFQQQLQAEMQSRMPSEVSTTAERWGPWLYYQRIPEGKEFPILCRRLERRDGLAASVLRFVRGPSKEEVLLDWNQIAEQFGYVHVGTCRISPDHRFLAYTLDVTGRELFMLRIKDLKTGSMLSKSNVEGVVSLAWAKDSCTLLYTVSDDSQRPHRVFGSRLESEDDILLFEENDRSCCVDITSTKDYQFITINSNSRTSSEVYLMDAADPGAGLQRVRKRVAGVQYFVEHHNGFFYILTNAPLENGNMIADNYHLTRCTVEDISSDKWQNVIQADQDVTIEDMDIFDKHLVLFLHDGGTPIICSLHMPLHIDSKNGRQLQELNPWLLPLPTDTCTVVPGSNHDFESSVFRAVISSPVMPEAIVDYDLLRQSFMIVQQEKVMGVRNTVGKTWSSMNCGKYSHTSEVPEILHMEADNFKKAEADGSWSDLAEMYTCEQRKVLSHDGFDIPLTIVHSRKIKQDGKNPGLIQGYGAYGEVLDKQWCSDRMSLLDRGWVIAFADVSGVERLLDRISNGVLAEDRRSAMAELQSVVSESTSAQLAFGAMGFPVLMAVLKEERDDVEMVRGALESLVSALTPIDTTHGVYSEVQPALMNSELLSRESESISLLLSLLTEDDFYIRYYTLQLLTALLTNCPARLQEAILATPRGITRLMDMLMDREVIRNEALLLLTYLTREAEEIQKIVVFEGAFEKIFNIIKEEGGSEGGIVVQDCLELLNNLLRNNPSNQILLRETIGLQPVVSLLRLRKGSADGFPQQKTVNLLGALETIALLLAGGPDTEPGKDANRISNQTVFSQKKLLDHLLMLCVESRWAAIAVRCAALRCIGDLVIGHAQNRDVLGSKVLGQEPDVEPALNSILRIFLRTTSLQECSAIEYVFKCFCEGNPDGQTMLASTITPLPQSSLHGGKSVEDDNRLPFGSMLVRALISSDGQNDLEASCRAASVLSHILKNNVQCKERVLRIQLEIPVSSLSTPELLMPRIVKYLAVASPIAYKKETTNSTVSETNSLWLQPVLLRLLVNWLADCPDAVNYFLDSPAHLTYMIELVSSSGSSASIHVAGLAAVLLGECIVFNKSVEDNRDAFMVVDAISQRIGLTAYFHVWEEMQNSSLFVSATSASSLPKPLTRSTAAEAINMSDLQDRQHLSETADSGTDNVDPLLTSFYDSAFVDFIKHLEPVVREQIVELFSRPKSKVAIMPAGLEQKGGESDSDYIVRLKAFMEKQCHEMQDLLGRNAALAEDLAKTRGDIAFTADSNSDIKGNNGRVQGAINGISTRLEADNLRHELQEAKQQIETLKAEKSNYEAEMSTYKQLAGKYEADLKSLSDAYNSLEQANYRLELEVKGMRGSDVSILPDLEAVREEGRQEAQKESEAELNDLLVCLGQEQSKVEKLSTRLAELGEDVDALLEGIGDEGEVQGDDEQEDAD